VSNKSKC